MDSRISRLGSIFLLSLIILGMVGGIGYANAQSGSSDDGAISPSSAPKSADSIPNLADEDSIVDPRGQTVKENASLDLEKTQKLDILNPIDWSLEIEGFKVVHAHIPVDLNVRLGMGFPLKAETRYDPYDVHPGQSFKFIVDVDNKDCTPYATLGLDFSMDFSELDFELFDSSNLMKFTADWGSITYSDTVTIPFYGTETKMGDWINYDIVDKYYSIDKILSIAGADISLKDYGLDGGVGVNINYRLHSWVTADATVKDPQGNITQSQSLRWDDLGSKEITVTIDSDALHGQYYSIDVGDWVYHIAQDVTFTVWANIKFDIYGIKLIDQTFTYAYTQNLGELTFPEKNDYTFHSKPQVLSGHSEKNVAANWNLIDLTLDSQGQSSFSALDYNWEIPDVEEIQEWFDDMQIAAGIKAGIGVNMPINILSYYNSRKVTPGSQFDYNLLVDSEDCNPPSIDYYVDGYVDLSNVSILGYQLDRYEFNVDDSLFEFQGITTPFEKQTWEYEITELVQLDKLSDMLNDWISSQLYGINPDIQFRAWIVLDVEGYLTGTVSVEGATINAATELKWDEQFDTQTTRIQIPANLNPGDTFTVSYSDLTYHLKITPGIKIGVDMLGGIIGFSAPIMLPVSMSLDDFKVLDGWSENITVQDVNVDADNLQVDNPTVENGQNVVTGQFDVTNTGGTVDDYSFSLIDDGLPSGTTASFSPSSITGLNPGDTITVSFTVNLGSNAHTTEYEKNLLQFKVSSTSATNPPVYDIIGQNLDIVPDPAYAPNAKIIMENEINVYPGITVVVPVIIQNLALGSDKTYTVSLSGDTQLNGKDVVYISGSDSITLGEGESGTVNLEIAVPLSSDSTPGQYSVTVDVSGDSQTLIYNIMPYTDVHMGIDPYDDPDVVVNLGDDSVFEFVVSNNGNSEAEVTVYVESDDIDTYNINSIPGSSTFNVSAGGSVDINVKLILDGVAPGHHSFTVIANESGSTIYRQTFDINIKQIDVQNIYADSYEYKDEPVTYTIIVQNVGNVGDEFTFGLTGLDPSAYNLTLETGAAPDDVFLPAGAPINLKLTIKPEDIRKVRPNVNGFQVKAESKTYKTETIGKASAVKMPAVYGFNIPIDGLTINDNESLCIVSFTIENTGNVDDVFTILVEGIDNQAYDVIYTTKDIFTSSVVVGNNTVSVGRGEVATVVVRIYKSIEGRYNPTIKVVNGDGEVLQSFKIKFVVGNPGLEWWAIMLLVLGAFGGVVVSYKVVEYHSNRQFYAESDEMGGGIIGSKIKEMKNRIGSAIEERRRRKILEELSMEEKVVEEDPNMTEVTPIKKSPKTPIIAGKIKEKIGVLGDKVKSIKEEALSAKKLSEDADFWDDEDEIDSLKNKKLFINPDDIDIDDDPDGWD